MSDQFAFLLHQLPNLLIGFPGQRPGGLLLSMALTAVAAAVGLALALFLGSGLRSSGRPLRWLCRLYVEIFRGIPLVLLLLLVHQVLGNGRSLSLDFSPRVSALITLILYSSAYQAEIVRAGLRAVPDHLIESARLMGSTPWQTFWLVKLRYVWRVMLPAFTGEAISLFKDTSVVIILGVAELMTVARIALGSDVTHAPYWVALYLLVGGLYLGVAFTLSRLAQGWERERQVRDLVHSLANY